MRRAADLLGESGPFASTLRGYEARQGQLDMADAVQRVLEEDGVLLCEAGTGTGKTLAYLVPAILSGRKVVVSTATKALQDQIFFKDLPLIERALGVQAQASLMKGLANYVCRRRHAEFLRSEEAMRPRYATALKVLPQWFADTETGDRAELVGLSETDDVWAQITSSSDTRIGTRCDYFNDCFVTRMRREAESARIIVVNHHLFFADLALRGPHPGRVIPDYDAVIFDEAHQLEDVATNFFGLRVSQARIARILGDAEYAFQGLGGALLSPGREGVHIEDVRGRSERLFEQLSARVGAGEPRRIIESDAWQGELQESWIELDGALEGLGAAATVCASRVGSPDGAQSHVGPSSAAVADALDVIGRRAQEVRDDLRNIVEARRGQVSWIDVSNRGVTLSASPVLLDDVFRQRIFERVPTTILTSATLSTSLSSSARSAAEHQGTPSAFPFLRARLGLVGEEPPVSECCIPSPFDFPKSALLYTPEDLPDPGAPDFTARAVERIAALVELMNGGAFVLTTSLRSMRALHSGLSRLLSGRPLLLQGEAPKAQLLGRFRAHGNAVLVATMGFWEGVDVPGRALRLVVLDKIPFPVPTDPIVQARSHMIEQAGGNPFMEFHVPLAQISLKQGFGRLIRHSGDVGVVALLDTRILRRGYGRGMLRSLPPATHVKELEDVRRFWSDREPTVATSS